MNQRTVDRQEKKLCLWMLCVGIGAFYGAVCGALFGFGVGASIPSPVDETSFDLAGSLMIALFGAAIGASLGAIGGCVTGAVRVILRGRLAWCLGVVLGSALPTGLMIQETLRQPALCIVLSIVFAGSLAAAVCWGLITGRSALPGVQQLATLASDRHPRPSTTKATEAPTEPTPASAAEGRGDEAMPVRPLE